jgi:hypothetical protein
MKPLKVLFFLCIVFVLLMFVSMVFPERGIKLYNKHRIQFPLLSEFIKQETVIYPDISQIINENADFPSKILKKAVFIDTTQINSDISKPLPEILSQQNSQNIQLLEIPSHNSSIFAQLFSDLKTLELNNEKIRILHYGDSQIESDRISSYIRYRLQKEFGGGGCGLFPLVPLHAGIPTLVQKNGPEWQRFTGFVKRDILAGHKRFGALFTFSRYEGSNLNGNSTWIHFQPSSTGNSISSNFNEISMFTLASKDSIELSVNINDSVIIKKVISPDPKMTRYRWKMDAPIYKVRLDFSGKGKLEVYSLSADKSWGVAVDNIPLRGSSGLEFSKTDTLILKEMYELMNIGMIILQFGGNIVPLMADDYSFYESFFKRELDLIKRILPNTPVIVIGPADMSFKEKGNYITYPGLTKVREAIRSATMSTGFVYWDMFEAMGGENSMPSWVAANPPLAASDFVHFTQRGARLIAEKFYDAFILEYRKWEYLSQTN